MTDNDRKRVEEIEARYNEAKSLAYATGKLPEFIDPEKEWLLYIIKSLEEENERLSKQLGAPYDLTVCQQRLDSARQYIETLKAQLLTVKKRVERMREALIKLHQSLAWNDQEGVWFLSFDKNPQALIEQALTDPKEHKSG